MKTLWSVLMSLCVSHTQQPNHGALQTSACCLCTSHALNHGHKDQATLGHVESGRMGWSFFKVGRSNAYLEVQRNKVRDTLEGSKAIYYCFTHSHAQSTNNQLMYRNNCSITTGAMDAATCDDFVAGKFAPAQGGALTAPCESCGAGKYSAALQGRRAVKGS